MRSVFALAATGVCASAAAADVTFLHAAADNTMFESPSGATSNGAGPNFFVGRNSQQSLRRSLLRFDLGDIPAGATITGVSLTLVASQTQGPTTDIALHRTLAAWGEGASSSTGGQGAPTQPGDATWIHTFFPASFWTTPGGDFAPLASALTPVGEPGAYTWSSTDSLIADVQSWLDAPQTNFGWTLIGREDIAGTSKRFESRENSVPEVRPVLAVEYLVPAPGVASLLGVAGLSICRRRRPGSR